ncbi:MAG: DUF2723 domain-containing protein, partial [Chloroflexota bacterium]
MAALGVAHPTGYPLYTLLGHLFTRLVPLGDMAYRVNLFSAVVGAAMIAVLYRLLCALKVAPLIALLDVLAFAVTNDVWTYATIAQTYALNLLLIALALWIFVRYQQQGDGRSLVALAFVMGLGCAHHSTFWLVVPALALGIVGYWPMDMRQRRFLNANIRFLPFAVIAFAVPLSLYLYIPLRGEQLRALVTGDVLGYPRFVTDGWVTPHYLAGWMNVVVGSFYASSTLEGAQVNWVIPITDYVWQLLQQFNILVALVLLCLVPVFRRNASFTAILIVAWLTNVFIVIRGVTAFNEPAGGLFTPTYLFCAILIALSA